MAQSFLADWISHRRRRGAPFHPDRRSPLSIMAPPMAISLPMTAFGRRLKPLPNVLMRVLPSPLMVLEARGLDVTPGMIERLTAAGDKESAAVLEIIYADEIGHVACGKRWFHALCMAENKDPTETFHRLCEQYFAGGMKPPFNHAARAAAGMERAYYDRDADYGPN